MSFAKAVKRIFLSIFILSFFPILWSCSSAEPEAYYSEPAYVSPYDWRNLELIEGRFYYSKDGNPASKTGVDVSEHQGEIDWEAVAADDIDFAFIRIGNRGYTEGIISLDDYYYSNISQARDAGLEIGVYFFSQAINPEEAREEARFVLNNLDGVELDFPVVYDHEPISDHDGRANHLNPTQLSENAQAFCSVIEEAEKSVMIYGNNNDIKKLHPEILNSRSVWFAEYNALHPSGQFDFVMWQYTSSGNVAGINTPADMNIYFLAP